MTSLKNLWQSQTRNIRTLFAMQMKDKIDFSFAKSTKQTIFKVVLSCLKFFVFTAIIYLAFYVMSFFRLVHTMSGIPQSVLTVIFTVLLSLSILVATLSIMKSLYFSKDNALLLTMPVKRGVVFTSKLMVFYVYELLKNINFILPLFVAYGLINKMTLPFFLWLPIALLLITALVVMLSALLSIPAMFISMFIKQNKILELVVMVSFIALFAWGLVSVIDAIPVNFDLIGTWSTTFLKVQVFLKNFTTTFLPFSWLTLIMAGNRYGVVNHLFTARQMLYTLLLVVAIVVVAAITYIIVRPLFFKMCSFPFEFKKTTNKKIIKNKKRSIFTSTIIKDTLLTYRNPERFYNLIFIFLGLPISIFLLNKIYSAMDTRLTGTYLTVMFNILMMLLLALSSNESIARIFSMDGESSYLQKTNPSPYLKTLTYRLILQATVVSISLFISVFIFTSFTNFGLIPTLTIFLVLEMFYISHLLWSAERDIMNPQTEHYKTTGTHLNNPNETKTTLSALLISTLVAIGTLFFIPEGMNMVWIRLGIFAVAFLLFRVWMYVDKIKVYFKERA